MYGSVTLSLYKLLAHAHVEEALQPGENQFGVAKDHAEDVDDHVEKTFVLPLFGQMRVGISVDRNEDMPQNPIPSPAELFGCIGCVLIAHGIGLVDFSLSMPTSEFYRGACIQGPAVPEKIRFYLAERTA